MIRVRCTAAVLVLLLSVTGCARNDSSVVPTNKSATEGDNPVENELTWQDAKARTQAMELEIAKLIPKGKVVKVDQMATGTLLGCGEAPHNWNGATTVTLIPGIEPEPLVKAIETKYQDSQFNIKTRTAPAGHYEVQLRSPDTAEIYLVGAGWDPDTIRIASGSACFTLPEGVYPGGEF